MKFRSIIFPLVTLLVGLLGNGAPLPSTRELVTDPAVRTTEVASLLVRDWQADRSLSARAKKKKPKPKEPERVPTPEPHTTPLKPAIKKQLLDVVESRDASKITDLIWNVGKWEPIHGLGTSEMQDYKLASMKGSDGFYHIGLLRVKNKQLVSPSLITVSWPKLPTGQEVKDKILAALK